MKINSGNFKDIKVYTLINDFFNYWTGDTSFYTEKTCRTIWSKYRFFPALFYDITYEELNESFFCNLYSQIEQKYVLGLNALIVWICENELVILKNADLIIKMKESLLNGGSRSDDIPYLFSDKASLALLADPEAFKTSSWVQLFFFDITELAFKHDDLRQAAIEYCDYLKVASDRIAVVKLKNLYNMRKLFKERFLDKDLSFFTFENIRSEIIQSYFDKQESYHHMLQRLSGFLIWLCDNGYINDPELLPLLDFKSYITQSFPKTKQLRRLFDVDHLDWNCIIQIKRKNTTDNSLFYLNSSSHIFREILKEYVSQLTDTSKELYLFTAEFEDSFENYTYQSPADLSFASFATQIGYFMTKYPDKPKFVSYVVGFYTLIAAKYNSRIFEGSGISTAILHKRSLSFQLYSGYKLIPYNPNDQVPSEDQWILCYPKNTGKNQDFSVGNNAVFDFSGIKDPDYRYYAKYCVWHDNSSYTNRKHLLYSAEKFFNYIAAIKDGSVLTIYTRPIKSKDITLEEILAYKTHIFNSVSSNRTRNHAIYDVRKVLSLLEDDGLISLPAGAYYHLRHKLDTGKSDANPISKEELALIANQMQKNSKTQSNIEYALCELIFYLSIETEFRISQILSLSTDCVKQTSKPDEYIVLSKTKTSGLEELEQPITIYTKRHIDEIIKLTGSYRNECLDIEMRKALFLIPAKQKRNSFAYVKEQAFNKYLHDICEQVNVSRYSFENLRDTHMTLAEEYQIRKGLSEMERTVLTGHVRPKSDLGYIGTDIRQMLEAVHGMIIGNIDVAGNVIKEIDPEIAVPKNTVSHQCGYCAVDCTDMSYLDCLMCGSFTTTIDRLPYFDERLKQIDALISVATIKHDKEDYICIKRLLLAYKEKILELQAEMEAN